MREQRTRSSPSALREPLTRRPLAGPYESTCSRGHAPNHRCLDHLARRVVRCRFTSGHSLARIEYITESRTVPSRRAAWWRITPSFFAPSFSIASCERKLKLSVRRPTTAHPRPSKAWVNSNSLQALLTCVCCHL